MNWSIINKLFFELEIGGILRENYLFNTLHGI